MTSPIPPEEDWQGEAQDAAVAYATAAAVYANVAAAYASAATVYADPEDAAGAAVAYTRIANAERAADAARAKVPR